MMWVALLFCFCSVVPGIYLMLTFLVMGSLQCSRMISHFLFFTLWYWLACFFLIPSFYFLGIPVIFSCTKMPRRQLLFKVSLFPLVHETTVWAFWEKLGDGLKSAMLLWGTASEGNVVKGACESHANKESHFLPGAWAPPHLPPDWTLMPSRHHVFITWSP